MSEVMATATMWYDNSVLMTFLGVILGAIIGFAGSLIQSRIAAKNNMAVAKAQYDNEIKRHYYFEKEKLYSELIGLIPQLNLSFDRSKKSMSLSRDQIIQINSFKARLSIFSSQPIYDEFYDLAVYITEEMDDSKVTQRINAFTEMLLADLKQDVLQNSNTINAAHRSC